MSEPFVLPTIQVLPATLANQIAAGEVVERPSSVVKELVENSLDAGASRIDVRIEAGGKRLIQVMDDGYGMHGEQLRLAVQQHATSKLHSVEGLFSIQTLGFRGEALPSLAAVSHFTLESRPAAAETGMALVMDGGRELSFGPVVMPSGTRIIVRRLFHHTPARLKFLKSDQTETGHVVEFCQRMALAYPEVSFRLLVNEREVLNIKAGSGDRSMQERLTAVFGPAFADHCLSFSGEHEWVRLSGWLGLPDQSRPNGSGMHLFVNGRWVRDRLLTHAIREIYRDLLPRDRFPALVVFLEMPGSELDVNVHPAKLEVRFRNQNMIFSAVKRLMGGALAGHGVPPVPETAAAPEPERVVSRLPEAVSRPVVPFTSRFPTLPFHDSSRSRTTPGQPGLPVARLAEAPQLLPNREQDLFGDFPLGEALGQIHDAYILARNRHGLVVVDQHAAHERIVYEALKSAHSQHKTLRQKLLFPEVLHLTPAEAEKLRGWVAELSDLGVMVEPFGGEAFVIRELPAQVAAKSARELVLHMVEELERYGQSGALEERRERLLITMACHGSVRSGRRMTIPEMNALLRQIETTPLADWCGHGRPTHMQITLAELEKMFHRR